MHFVNHNFTDIDFETKHMCRIEKTIYFDLRSLYLSEEKAIDGSDMALLERRLSVISDDEKQALAFVLKDKFTKAGKLFRRAEWDKIIKDYKFQQISTALSDMAKRLRAAGVTIEANAGMSAIRDLYLNRFGSDKLTRITNKANAMTNEANVKANRANGKANAMTNVGEYKLTSNDERKFMVNSLKDMGESVTLKTAISTLRELYAKSFNSDSKVDATNAIYQAKNMTNTNANPMKNAANVMTNETNAENDAITINHEPVTNNHKPIESDARTNASEFITADDFQLEQYTEEDIKLIEQKQKKLTSQSLAGSQPTVTQPVSAVPVITQLSANQPVTKADQIRNQHAEDIEYWVAPTIEEMRGELFRAGKLMQLTDDQYALHIEDFKAHYAEQALLGKPISTESNRRSKLRKWLMGEVDKQAQSQARQEKAKGTFNIDNEDWSGTTEQYKPAQSNSDLPDVFHPSHTQPTSQAKRDPSVSVMVNGLWKEPLPGMNVQQTYDYIAQCQTPGEMQDEAYDRLLNRMQEAA